MKKNVSLTIIMPVYNGEKYLKQAISSILDQTYTDFEVLLLNDASDDSSQLIINEFDDQRIKKITHKDNKGLIATLNEGIRLAKGSYIARMDQDDISLPNRLEKQIYFLENNPTYALVATTVDLINENETALGIWEDDRNNISSEEISKHLIKSNCIAHPTIMIRSNVIKEYLYSNTFGAEDYNLWLRLVADGHKLTKINEALLKYRIHSESTTQTSNLILGLKKNINAKKSALSEMRYFNTFAFKLNIQLIIDNVLYFLIRLKKICYETTIKFLAVIGYCIGFIFKYKISGTQVFFFPYYHTGGAEFVHIEILKILKNKDKTIFITDTSNNTHHLKTLHSLGNVIDISKLTANPLLYCVLQGIVAHSINKNNGISEVFGSNSSFFYRVLSMLRKNIKKIDLLHALGAHVEEFTIPFLKHLDKRVIITKSVGVYLDSLYKINKLQQTPETVLISNYVEIPEKIEKNNTKIVNVLFVSRNSEEKRIYLAEKIAQKIASDTTNVHFIGDMPAIVKNENIFYHGTISDRKKMKEMYKKADLILLTSSREGFPIVLMEAMAHGVIPVTTNVGGIKDHIIDKVNGILIENKSEEYIINECINEITNVRKDSAFKHRLSLNAFKYATKHFNYENFKNSYENLFRIKPN